MSGKQAFQCAIGLVLIIGLVIYTQTAGRVDGAVVFAMSLAVLTLGFFAGDEI